MVTVKSTSENIARLPALYRDAEVVQERRSLFTEKNCRGFISKLMAEYLPDVPDMDEQSEYESCPGRRARQREEQQAGEAAAARLRSSEIWW